MAVLAMIIVHIYFAVRPEKLWVTRSMLLGWITRSEYLEHPDTKIWQESDPEIPVDGDGQGLKSEPDAS